MAIRTSSTLCTVERQLEQITREHGNHIDHNGGFYIIFATSSPFTRRQMIGTIVTYELVLLQFDKGDPKTEQVDDTRLEQFCHHVRVRVS